MNYQIKFKKFNMARTRTATFKTESEANAAKALIEKHPITVGQSINGQKGFNKRFVKAVGECSSVEVTEAMVNSTFANFKIKYN